MRTHLFRKLVVSKLWLASFVVLLVAASTASAHFVWIESARQEKKLLIRSGFGEPDGWDPDLIDRIKQTVFYTSGKKEPVKLEMPLDEKEKEYRTTLEGPLPAVIFGVCDFGVIQFGTNPASHLRYTAKNLTGPAKDWSDDKATKSLRIELLAKLDGEHVSLKAVHLGKPLKDAKIKCTTPKGDSVELTTDSKGSAKWPLAGEGVYRCYVGVTTPEEGKLGEKEFKALKDYTTLTFTIGR